MLGCSKAEWLGLLAEDVEQLVHQFPNQLLSVEQVDATILARRTKSLESQVDAKHDPIIQSQCSAMCRLGVKAEIECLTSISRKYLLNVYIARKLQQRGLLPADINYEEWDRNLRTEATTDINHTSEAAHLLSYTNYNFSDIPALEYSTQFEHEESDLTVAPSNSDAMEETVNIKPEPAPAATTASQRWWWESSDDEEEQGA